MQRGAAQGRRRFAMSQQTPKKTMPKTVVSGEARPISVRDALGSTEKNIQSGMRTNSADSIPCAITGSPLPRPLKYPIALKRMHVRTHSGEKPLRYAALSATFNNVLNCELVT